MNSITDGLNREQKEAVEYTEGPLLILAGAGSGKTRVLTHRAGYLLSKGVMPWNILAITFTNKAAGEMRERVNRLITQFEEEGLVSGMHGSAEDIFVSTFHSMCVRLLRRNINEIGYDRDFSIYDTDDQKTLLRNIIKSLNLDPKMYREKAAASAISSAKNNMIGAVEYKNNASDFYERNIGDIYIEYEKQMKSNNALDFDDLLLKTVEMFNRCPEVLSYYQERFRYIMVDEYQDTNNVQFELIRLLSAKYKNLCVVGDDDQSIYKFRGANIENILSFEHTFPDTKVIKLEQNYRSTGNILNAANCVIKNNKERKEKSLWTDKGEGEKPVYREYETAAGEAEAIIKEARDTAAGLKSETVRLKNQAVLYRTNAQSRLLEECCIKFNVPYIIVGGVNFYQRKEIKDVLSYLRVISNSVDDLAVKRIINTPKRGIGQTTEEKIGTYAALNGLSFFDACRTLAETKAIGSAAKKIEGFIAYIDTVRDKLNLGIFDLQDLIRSLVNDTGYKDELLKEGEIEAQTRLDNIEEFINKAVQFQEAHEAEDLKGLSMLSAFLEEVSLVSDIDRTNDTDDVLTMLTLHSAKGLEFEKVYIAGMEEGLFPSSASINADDPEAEIEEERRLCYVGITRAKSILHLYSAKERMVNGEIRLSKPSRFIEELPDEYVKKYFKKRVSTWIDHDDNFENPIPRRGFVPDNKFSGAFAGFGGFGSLDKTKTGKKTGTVSAKSMPQGVSKGIVKEKPAYDIGDTVSHVKFGKGIVQDIKDGERDYEVTVDFEGYGIKKMFAGFAKLAKL